LKELVRSVLKQDESKNIHKEAKLGSRNKPSSMSGGYAGKSKNRNNSEIQESEKSININSSMFGKKK
jgi:hypothetical protein